MKSNVWYLAYYKTIEILFGSLLLTPYYMLQNQAAPIGFYLFLTIPSTYIFIYLIHRYQQKSRFLFFIIVFPIIVIGGLLLGFSILFVLFLTIMIYWRSTIMNHDGDSVQTGFWLFLTIFVGFVLLICAKIYDYPTLNPLMFVMFGQLVFIIGGGFMINWLSISGNKLEKRLLLRNFLSIIGIMAAISLLFVTFRGLIKWIVLSLMNLLTLTGAFIVSPLFNWVEHYELTGEMNPFSRIQQNMQLDSEKSSFIRDNSQGISQNGFDQTYLFIILAIILFGVLFFFLYKKFQGSTEVLEHDDQTFFISSSFDEEEKGLGLLKNKSIIGEPSYRIRKEIYQLEKLAEKLKLGRHSSETLGEWFKRVGIEEDELIQSVYEKVRYGNVIESDEEYKMFYKSIEKKKTDFKSIYKKLIEDGTLESPSIVKNIFKGFRSK